MKFKLSEKVCRTTAVCALLLLMGCQASAQTKATPVANQPVTVDIKQRSPGRRGARRYNVNTVETQRGRVVSIERISSAPNNYVGIHITLAIGDERLPVHLGPAWYLEEQVLTIEINDEIEVTGSRVVFDDNPALIAAEIDVGDTVIILRDRDGIPRWRHQGPRGPR